VTVTGLPQKQQAAHGELRLPPAPDGEPLTCPYDRFDIEGPFPYADGTFDVVILTEVLEHITCDPMHTLGEINRITAPGGWLLVSTPNCCSLRSVVKAIRGHHPYIWSPYSKAGHRDRHNREYTPDEVRWLLENAGYEPSELLTRNDAYGSTPSLGRRLVKGLAGVALTLASAVVGRYVAPALRGESIFALARKVGPVANRFPAFLYY
jgi:SAM-dependent methyltransferase